MSTWTPSIVPQDTNDQTVYLVMDDLGRLGQVWMESAVDTTDLETVITDLLSAQYYDPVRVIAFNIAEGWARDVSEDVARELRRRCELQLTELPAYLEEYVSRFETAGSS